MQIQEAWQKEQKTEYTKECIMHAKDLYFDKLSGMLCKEESIVGKAVMNSAVGK
jgi:hypothetical protein